MASTPLQNGMLLARAISSATTEAKLLIGLPRVAAQFGYATRALHYPGRALQIIGADAEIIALAHDRPHDIIEHVVAVVSATDPNVADSAGTWTEELLFTLNVPDETDEPSNVVDLDARRGATG